jgi:MFS family permease
MNYEPKLKHTLLIVWPLLIGMFLIMVGNGLQGTLVALRAELDGFSISMIGVIMSIYYCGYVVGWYIVPSMIRSVGHIRVFAGFASLASTTILIQGLFIDPYIWIFIRFICGISFVGLFIVSESWLNNIATNRRRAQILSTYMFVVNFGLFCGQFLINLGSIETMGLFVLVSILISLSLLPITLTNKISPKFEDSEYLPFRKLFNISPFGVACVIASGICGASLLTLGPIYAKFLGFSLPEISLFMASFIAGCAILPLLTGWISDKIDRRRVIISITFFGFIISIIACLSSSFLIVTSFLFGGCVTSIYSISAAHINDHLKSSQITSATASLILINGISSCIAPIILAVLLDIFGANIFFIPLSVAFFSLFIFGIYRDIVGKQIAVEDQTEFRQLPTESSPSIVYLSHPEEKK